MTLNRRRLLGGLVGASALSTLLGCDDLQIKDLADNCPRSTANSVGWVPDVGHPVFWGFQDVGTPQGAPRDIRIYYPTDKGFTDAPPILQQCIGRWPVVLFLHGQPPNGIDIAGYQRRFALIGADLARCGYVVVAPNHGAELPKSDRAPELVAQAMADVAWVREQWSESKWVDKTSTAVMGHSYGALLAARVAAAHPEIGALVSLSGGYHELNDPLQALQAVTVPSFFMWAQGGNAITEAYEELDGVDRLWDKLTQLKYAAPFQGEHFDYLRAGDAGGAERGPCTLIPGAAADLAALFISAHVPVPSTQTTVPRALTKPNVQLTPEQELFAGAHLSSIEQILTDRHCRIDLRWRLGTLGVSRRLGLG